MLRKLAFGGLGFALLITPLLASAQTADAQIAALRAQLDCMIAKMGQGDYEGARHCLGQETASGGGSGGSTQNTPTPSNTYAAVSCVSISSYLYLRKPALTDADTNGDVTLLQKFLSGRGYSTRVSGTFDANTRDMLQEFQEDNRIAPEGVTGPITRGKIRALTCGSATPSTATITGYLYAAADEPFSISGSASPAGSVLYVSVGNNFASANATVEQDRTWSVYFASGLPAGAYQVIVRANSSSGAVLTSSTLTVVGPRPSEPATPINPASVPTIEFVSTPTLSLQPDESGDEAAIQAEATVKVTTGNMPIDAGNIAYMMHFYRNGHGISQSNSMRFSAVSSTVGRDNRIPANTSATFRITGTAPTGELLAGSYTLSLQEFWYPDLSNPISTGNYSYQAVQPSSVTGVTVDANQIINGIAITGCGNSSVANTCTIVGELSPYIVSAEVDNAGNARITGTRFSTPSLLQRVTVSIGGRTSVYLPVPSVEGDYVTFNMSDFRITTSGYYNVQILNSVTGNSNIVKLHYEANGVSSPTVTVISPNGREVLGTGPLTVVFRPENGQGTYISLNNGSNGGYGLIGYFNNSEIIGTSASRQSVTLNLPVDWIRENGSLYKIQVCSERSCDSSDDYFSITSASTQAAAPVISLTLNGSFNDGTRYMVDYGRTVNVGWNVTNPAGTTCEAAGTGVWGDLGSGTADATGAGRTTNGTWTTPSLYTNTTYGIRCTNSLGTTYKYLYLYVQTQASTSGGPGISITVDPVDANTSNTPYLVSSTPVRVGFGKKANIGWGVSNSGGGTSGITCLAAGTGLGGRTGYESTPLSGTWTTPALYTDTTYGIQCANSSGGITTRYVVIDVGEQASATSSFGSGSLSVATDSSSPSYKIAAGGSTGVVLGIYRFRASGEDVALQTIRLSLANGNPSDLSTVYLYDSSNVLRGRATFIGNDTTTTSTLFNPLSLTKDRDEAITVKGDIADIGTSQPGTSGNVIKVNFLSATGYGITTGSTITANGNTAVAGVRIFNSYPMVAQAPIQGGAGSISAGKLMRFSVTANDAGDVGINHFAFNVSMSSGLTLAGLGLYAYADSGYSIPISGQGASGLIGNTVGTTHSGRIEITIAASNPTAPVEIPAGGTRYFELRGSVGGIVTSSNQSITTILLGDATYDGMRTASNVAGNFVWSPNTLTTSSAGTNDWTNGFGVMGLPSGGLVQTIGSIGSGATASATTVITVNNNNADSTMSYSQTPIAFGGTATFNWSVSPTTGTTCYAAGVGLGGTAGYETTALSGNWTTSPLYTNTTYGMRCTNSGGTTYKYVNVTVQPQANTVTSATACGSASGISSAVTPAVSTLCASGNTAGSVSSVTNSTVNSGYPAYTWTCSGVNSTPLTLGCMAPKTQTNTTSVIATGCGSATNLPTATPPSHGLCLPGNTTSSISSVTNATVNNGNPAYVWTCSGANSTPATLGCMVPKIQASTNTSVPPIITVNGNSTDSPMNYSQTPIAFGGTASFYWNVTPATGASAPTCYAAGNGLGGATGYETIPLSRPASSPWTDPSPLRVNTRYGIQCTNSAGTTYKYVDVAVAPQTNTTTAAPVINSVTPSNIAAGGSATLTFTISGTGFPSNAVIDWHGPAGSGLAGTIPAASITRTSTSLTFVLGAFSVAGNWTYSVRNPSTGQTSNEKTFTVAPAVTTTVAPVINSVNSASVAVGSNVSFTLNGTNFPSGAVIDWHGPGGWSGTIPAASITRTSTSLTFAPGTFGIAGDYAYSVRNPSTGQTSNEKTFTVAPAPAATTLAPVINSVNPASVAVGSNVSFTLNGTNFPSNAVIDWHSPSGTSGTIPASSITNYGTSLVFSPGTFSPAGAWTYSVRNPSNGQTSNEKTFTVAPAVTTTVAPVINSVTPSNIAVGSSVTFTISGTDFPSGAVIDWHSPIGTSGTISAASITRTATTLTFSPGAFSVAGNWTYSVRNPSTGQTSNEKIFTVSAAATTPAPAPIINSVTPSNIAVGGSATLTFTISGTDFPSGAVIDWHGPAGSGLAGTIPAASITRTATTLTFALGAFSVAGNWTYSVRNPSTGQTSNEKTFTVAAAATTAAPRIDSVTPSSIAVGSSVTFTINGSDFPSGAVIDWHSPIGTSGTISAASITRTATTLTFSPGAFSVAGNWTYSVRNSSTGQTSNEKTFTVADATPPTVTLTSAASSVISEQSTTLDWHVSPTTSTCSLSSTGTYNGTIYAAGNVTPLDRTGWGTSDLTTSTTYTMSCTNAGSTATSRSVTISVITPPTVTTLQGSNVTSTSVTLKGSANPNGGTGTGWFQGDVAQGSCESFGYRFPTSGGAVSFGRETWAVTYSQSVPGLAPSTTYYYCAVAQNPAGTTYGNVRTVTTAGTSAMNNRTNQTASAAGAFPLGEDAFIYTWNNDLQVNSQYTADIKALQTALAKEGVYIGEVTGGFHMQTYYGVKRFQEKYGIDSTGFVGTKTRAKLNELY
ncbi:MAG: peptidoglycan-binding protein [bacterium]|nr:peptidoglycan-binding protein [bacterium]